MAIARFAGTTNPVAAEQVIKTSLLLPANQEILRSLNPLAKVEAESLTGKNPNTSRDIFVVTWRWVCLALMEYREGNCAKAVEWCRKCLAPVNPASPP